MACGGYTAQLLLQKRMCCPNSWECFQQTAFSCQPLQGLPWLLWGPYSKTEQYGRLKANPSGPSLERLWKVILGPELPWSCTRLSLDLHLNLTSLSLPIPALFPTHPHPMSLPPSSDVDCKNTPLWTSCVLNSISESVSLGTQPMIWSISKYTKPDITLTH